MNRVFEALCAHLKAHPKAEVQDAVKFLYQASFGGGHFLSDSDGAYQYLLKEAEETKSTESAVPYTESLGENYARINLSALKELSPKTLFAMFKASSENTPADKTAFLSLLDALENADLFDKAETKAFLEEYRAAGCPSVHHSEAYRAHYHPAYRVVKKAYADFLPAFIAIDKLTAKKSPVTVAIDGLCGSGKTTFASLLTSVYDCNLFHADDFYLPMDMRTPERYATPGGNVHWERILSDILEQIPKNAPFSYRVFDCGIMDLGDTVQVTPKALNILEGSYSTHPQLINRYDLKIFLKTPPEVQSARILKRNGPARHKMFVEKWIPLENLYFTSYPVEQQCDLVFTT